MAKQEEFLFIAQTIILTNSINLACNPEINAKYRHEFSATGVAGLMLDLMWAKDRIPDDKTAHDAAIDFISYMLGNLRDQEEKATSRRMNVPHWFAR